MNGKLSRKWARICIVFAAAFLCCMAMVMFTGALYWYYIGIGAIIPAFLIKIFVLRCPGCGNVGAVPQWSKSGTYYCPRCGTKLEYDDQ